MHGSGKSDDFVVPKKPSNNGCNALQSAEKVEGRESAKGNSSERTRFRTQSRDDLQRELGRIRQAAMKDKKQRFTALWHHVYHPERLQEEYFNLKRQAAAGVDGMTWHDYGRNLDSNIQDLSARLRRGAFQAKPVKRVYVPKSDGRQRPIGIPTLEDKIVQRSVVSVLQAIYETEFLGFSYGFRPKRGAHMALDALALGITWRKVSWILDADIRGYFNAMSHEWIVKFVEHRIADRRVIHHIKKWLKAGVLEEDKRIEAKEGTVQGGSISPLLSNIYLHYVFDLWIENWRNNNARGDIIIVRYADDFVIGFQYKWEAERFREELEKRFERFNLELHDQKTRLIEFGRFAAERRKRRGENKPETFDFLGFTHICSKTSKSGKYVVYRRPIAKRVRAKLKEIKEILLKYRHSPIPDVGKWLNAVMRGWYRYYALPLTFHSLESFRRRVAWHWFRALRRRSQRSRMTWRRMFRLIDRWLPKPRIMHPYPEKRMRVMTQGRSPVR